MNKLSIAGYDCEIENAVYKANKQISLQLVAADTSNNHDKGLIHGEPIMRVTTCIADYDFNPGETAIKNHDENTGILDLLIRKNIVAHTGNYARSGNYSFPVVKLLI